MSDDHLVKKQALLDDKKINLKQSPYWNFFKGVNPLFWSKFGNFLFVCFLDKMGHEVIFDDHVISS